MPSGYTAAITEENIDFPTFVMQCARAFGALIEMRDKPTNAPIPDEFKPSDYHRTEREKAEKELARLDSLTVEQIQKEFVQWQREEIKDAKESQQKRMDVVAKYEAMLAQVLAWTPPTSEHENLKKFMTDQITESIKFDGPSDYYDQRIADAKKMTSGAWWTEQVNRTTKDIEYHTKEHQEEVKRAAERSQWVRDLRKSLCDDASPRFAGDR